MTMPKIQRIITRLNIGGPARQALLLTKALQSTYPTTLAAGRPTQSEGEMFDPEVKVAHVPLVRPVSIPNDLAAFHALRQIMLHGRPDLVHTHMAKAGALGRLAAMSLKPRPRLIHTFHGHVLDGYFSQPVQRTLIRTERWLAERTDCLIAVSPQIRDQLLAAGVGRPEQYRVIPVGIDLSRHALINGPQGGLRRSLNLPPDALLAGTVGRLVPIKDHVTLLRALVDVPSLHLAVIGDGELRSQLEALAAELSLSDRVHFTGWRSDIPSTMSDLDLVVLTSRNEGTPVSLIEAMACGRPVVATDVGGVCSVVTHGVNGFLTPAGDPGAIARAMQSVLDNRTSALNMAEAARQQTLTRFGCERLIRDIESLYSDLTGA